MVKVFWQTDSKYRAYTQHRAGWLWELEQMPQTIGSNNMQAAVQLIWLMTEANGRNETLNWMMGPESTDSSIYRDEASEVGFAVASHGTKQIILQWSFDCALPT